MIELNTFIILFYTFIAAVFFIVTIGELRRGETLIKTCFVAGIYCIILALLYAMVAYGIIDMNLLIILVIIEFVMYILITIYAFKYVRSTIVYSQE